MKVTTEYTVEQVNQALIDRTRREDQPGSLISRLANLTPAELAALRQRLAGGKRRR